jgi:Glycosyltransferase family 87
VDSRKEQLAASGFKSRRAFLRIFIAGMLCLHLFFFIHLRGRIKRGYPDFTVFYTAASILREGFGHQLYDERLQYEVQIKAVGQIPSRRGPLPYNHPPFEALIFLPLSRLPYLQAFAVWDLLNLAAVVAVPLLLRPSIDTLRLIAPWEFVIGSLAFFPVFACFLQGQDSILLLMLCVLGFKALSRDADFLAGCWFALGTFKFQLIIPVVLLVIIWKSRRLAAGFAATSILLAFVSAGLVGWQALLHYPGYVLEIAKAPSLGEVPSQLMPNLRGLLLGWPLPFSGAVGNTIAVLSSALLFLFAAVKGQKTRFPKRLELQFSLAIAVSVLVSWHTNAHDLSLLVLPLVLIGDYCLHALRQEPRRRLALMLPVLPILLSPLWAVLWLVSGTVNLMAIPLLWWVWEIGKELSSGRNLGLIPGYTAESGLR